ncbi:B12-binding domain-containing radical SAM protein [Caldicellulosiruptor naganoensis]|uniref:B12-binding domain-containing radical SAM protein n=1 Tax=Caldicellulosiruptor naganoensis TaxID=29324 RepID=A0ABY7BK14_9FIRM|nr:radical SAM protein [Caldicellulosiruptor naganoensis]WAM32411.1 B12-binding domain-containing radical SAM protein [Caldicellulosiruptor naganoensis]
MILLVAINSKYVHTNLAVRYLYQLCKENYPCEYVEFNINQSLHDVIYEILSKKPEYVAISTYIWNRSYVEKLVEGLKKAQKSIKIILGGPEVYFDSLDEWKFVDIIIRGEGEYPFLDLCDHIAAGRQYTQKEYPPFDLNKLPFAYKDEKLDQSRIYYYESSRGCPFRCSYCLSSIEKGVRFVPLEKVFEELDYLFKKQVRLIKFVDRTFNANKERAIKIIEFCKQKSQATQIHFEIDPTLLDSDIITAINTSKDNLFRLEIGLQSFNPQTLDAIDRFYDIDRIDKNLKKLMENKKAIVHLDLIAGLPYEDFLSFKRSLDKTILYFADEVQLGFLKMLKGTKIREEAAKYNYEFFKDPPYEVISNSFISFEEIYELKKIEDLIDKIYNRQYLYFTLRYIFQKISPSEFFEKLSSKVNSNLNTREFIKELYRVIKENFDFDKDVFDSLFRFDILRRFPEEFLPEELAISGEEREKIRQAIYQATSYQDLREPKEIIRRSRACIFGFDIETFIEDNKIENGDFLYIFFEEKVKKIKLQ